MNNLINRLIFFIRDYIRGNDGESQPGDLFPYFPVVFSWHLQDLINEGAGRIGFPSIYHVLVYSSQLYSRHRHQGEGVKKQIAVTTAKRTTTTTIEITAQSGSPNMFLLFFSEFIVPP
jgi:hypothetical protein